MWLAQVTYYVSDAWDARRRFAAVRSQDACLGCRLAPCCQGYEIQAFFACSEDWLPEEPSGGCKRIFVSPESAVELGVGCQQSDLGPRLVFTRLPRQLDGAWQWLQGALSSWSARFSSEWFSRTKPERSLVPFETARKS